MQIYHLNVFTCQAQGGNPCAVVIGFQHGPRAMQELARSLGMPETIFIQLRSDHCVHLRFFSLDGELPLCGHGVLAATYLLQRCGFEFPLMITTQENLEVQVYADADQVDMLCAPAGLTQDVPELSRIYASLGISSADLDLDLPLSISSIGSRKLLLPLDCRSKLAALTPDYAAIAAWSEAHQVNGLYCYCKETLDPSADFHARSFNPRFGHPEDAATGVAAGALMQAMAGRATAQEAQLTIEQGHALGQPSLLRCAASQEGIRVGGAVTLKQRLLSGRLSVRPLLYSSALFGVINDEQLQDMRFDDMAAQRKYDEQHGLIIRNR